MRGRQRFEICTSREVVSHCGHTVRSTQSGKSHKEHVSKNSNVDTKTQYYEGWVDGGRKWFERCTSREFLATLATQRKSNLNSKR